MKTVMLTLLLAAAVAVAQPSPEPRVVEVHAKRFEFTPNVIKLKKDEPVTIRLVSTDHSHGLLIDALNVDLDAGEEKPGQVTITPTKAGTFPAICDHYCGSGHGNMKMTIVVE